jgi:hypothetical protein
MRARSATHTRGLLVGTATTASPVSGSDVRHKMIELAEETARTYCAKLLAKNFFARRMRRESRYAQAELMRQVRPRPMGARSRGISTASHRVSPRQMREDKLMSEVELERREMRAVMAMGDEASRDTPEKLRGNAPSVAKENGVHHQQNGHAVAAPPPAAGGGGAVDPRLQKAFEKYDRDSSGSIERAEVPAVLRLLGINTDGDAQVSEVLARYDQDSSGHLSVVELAAIVGDIDLLKQEYGVLDRERSALATAAGARPPPPERAAPPPPPAQGGGAEDDDMFSA